jgi:hypothetical protein
MKLAYTMLGLGVLLSSTAFAAPVQSLKSDEVKASAVKQTLHQPAAAHARHHRKKK